MFMSPEFYEAFDGDIEAFFNGEFDEPEVEVEDGDVDEDEVVANWREGEDVFEAIEDVEREDAHLESMYEYMQDGYGGDWDNIYGGCYSEE